MPFRRSVPTLVSICSLLSIDACADHSPGRHVSPTGQDAGDCRRAPCRTIGYAIRQASPGDTISVDSGTYRESVHVTRRLTLLGHHATIDAAGQATPPNGILVEGDSAAGTRVAGFTIRNAGLEGIFVLRTSHITIENDSLFGNDAYGPDNPLCTKHQSDCGEAIHLQAVTHAVVRGNVLHHNMGGILLTDEDGPTSDNLISENIITDSPKDCGITLASHWLDTLSGKAAGPEVAGVYHNTVQGNTVSGSGGVGIGIFTAGPGAAAWENTVDGNTVTKSEFSGLAIHGHAPAQNLDGNILRNNILSGNGIDVENPVARKPAGISIFTMGTPIRGTVVGGNRISDEHHGIIALRVESIAELDTNLIDPAVPEPTSVLSRVPKGR